MNETTKNYLDETTQLPTETTEQTTKQKEKQNKNLNKHKNKQNINTEGSGNNYWRFFAEPNIYRTTTEFPLEQQQEEETQFYNADKYFHLPNRRQNNKQRENENVLTFCTKASAIRDSSNLPIACAGEDGQIWQPQRCPPGTGCMPAADSAFHICCPVGIASISRRR